MKQHDRRRREVIYGVYRSLEVHDRESLDERARKLAFERLCEAVKTRDDLREPLIWAVELARGTQRAFEDLLCREHATAVQELQETRFDAPAVWDRKHLDQALEHARAKQREHLDARARALAEKLERKHP